MYVYALASMVVANPAGGTVRIREGDVWAADDPLVKARPALFSRTPVAVHRTVSPVEQATAAPGEKRRRG